MGKAIRLDIEVAARPNKLCSGAERHAEDEQVIADALASGTDGLFNIDPGRILGQDRPTMTSKGDSPATSAADRSLEQGAYMP